MLGIQHVQPQFEPLVQNGLFFTGCNVAFHQQRLHEPAQHLHALFADLIVVLPALGGVFQHSAGVLEFAFQKLQELFVLDALDLLQLRHLGLETIIDKVFRQLARVQLQELVIVGIEDGFIGPQQFVVSVGRHSAGGDRSSSNGLPSLIREKGRGGKQVLPLLPLYLIASGWISRW